MIDTKIIEWFNKYHDWEDNETMTSLYEDLVDEEIAETRNAILSWNIAESFDWLWDTYWVTLWAWHYYMLSDEPNADIIAEKYFDWLRFIRKLMWDKFEPVMNEILLSNNTKVKDTQKNGKIKKWPNFIKPNILQALWINE